VIDMPLDIDWQVFVTAMVLVPVAYAATNVDNLLIMSTLAAGRASRGSLITGFLVASFAVLVIVSLATFIARAIPHEVLGYLGFVPMSIGIYLLLFTGSAGENPASGATTWPAVAAVLFANSSDTIFAVGPLFAESGDGARVGLAIGFTLIAAVWLILILGLSSRIAKSETLGRIGHRIAPWMMILVGLYILSDSATDLV
jgi:cadmium resistance protein CadD (predicted permease)